MWNSPGTKGCCGHRRLGAALILFLLLFPRMACASTYGQRIVAAVLMGEARGEGEIGMTAVAEVIHNRAVESGKSPLEVVTIPRKFTCLNGTTPEGLYRKFYRLKLYATALNIARKCYNEPSKLPNLTKGATFYDHKNNRPFWAVDMNLVASVGNHNFYSPRHD